MIPAGRLLTEARGSLVRDEIWQIFLDLQETDKPGDWKYPRIMKFSLGRLSFELGG